MVSARLPAGDVERHQRILRDDDVTFRECLDESHPLRRPSEGERRGGDDRIPAPHFDNGTDLAVTHAKARDLEHDRLAGSRQGQPPAAARPLDRVVHHHPILMTRIAPVRS